MTKISVVMRKHLKKVPVTVIARAMVTQDAKRFGMTMGTEIAIFEWGMLGNQATISKNSSFKGTTLYAIAVKNVKGDWIANMGSQAFLWDTVKHRFEGCTGQHVSEPTGKKLK